MQPNAIRLNYMQLRTHENSMSTGDVRRTTKSVDFVVRLTSP